jgi:transketolase
MEILQKIPKEKSKPNLIIANTVKGAGVSFIENQIAWHHKVPSESEYNMAMKELDEALLNV